MRILGEMLGLYKRDEKAIRNRLLFTVGTVKFTVFYAKLPGKYLCWVKEKDKLIRPFSGDRIALKRSHFLLLRLSKDRFNFLSFLRSCLLLQWKIICGISALSTDWSRESIPSATSLEIVICR